MRRLTPDMAVEQCFRALTLSHTPVVLLTKLGSTVAAEQFVYGTSASKPWGLPFPICSSVYCRSMLPNFNLRGQPSDSGRRIRVSCSHCAFTTVDKSLARPSWVDDFKTMQKEAHRYRYSFPTPDLEQNLKWDYVGKMKEACGKASEWTRKRALRIELAAKKK